MGEIERSACAAQSEGTRYIVTWLRPPKGWHRATVERVTLEASWPPTSALESRGLPLTPALILPLTRDLDAQAAYRDLFPALARKYDLVERK